MFGIGGSLSSGDHQLIRLATMGLILSGVGLAGYGFYGNQQATEAQTFVQEHAKVFIGIGIAAIVLGAILNFWMSRRMMRRMTAGMAGMGGIGGMPMMPGMGMPPKEVVKVRCKSCGSLQDEGAEFCSKCGKPMV